VVRVAIALLLKKKIFFLISFKNINSIEKKKNLEEIFFENPVTFFPVPRYTT